MIDIAAAEKYVKQNQPEIINILVDFTLTDVILFWNSNAELMKKQKLGWQPLLDWLLQEYHIKLIPTTSLEPPQENKQQCKSLQQLYGTLYLKDLTAFYLAATSLKSTILGFALVKNKINSAKAHELSFMEELHQNIFWGEDEEAVKNREKVHQDLQQIEEYLQK